jgi:hypothetical protein
VPVRQSRWKRSSATQRQMMRSRARCSLTAPRRPLLDPPRLPCCGCLRTTASSILASSAAAKQKKKKDKSPPRGGLGGGGCRSSSATKLCPPGPELLRQTNDRSAGCLLDPSYTAGRKGRLGRWRSAFAPAVLIYYHSWMLGWFNVGRARCGPGDLAVPARTTT